MISRRVRWLAVALPALVVGIIELLSDTVLDPYLPFPWDTILVSVMVAVLVLGLVTRGLRNKEIAAALGISENTVKFHRKHILEKLHAGSRAELAARAVGEGLVPPPGDDRLG